jgi:hypothetical protein
MLMVTNAVAVGDVASARLALDRLESLVSVEMSTAVMQAIGPQGASHLYQIVRLFAETPIGDGARTLQPAELDRLEAIVAKARVLTQVG